MKKVLFSAITISLLNACSKHDHNHDHETITKVEMNLISNSHTAKFTFSDPDGDGGNAPIIQADTLLTDKNYTFSTTVSNADGSINSDIRAQATAHQFFYFLENGSIASIQTTDNDPNGNPLGLEGTLTTNPNLGSTNLKLTLRHNPKKPNNGSLSDAGGETDVEVTFPVVVK